MNKFTLVLACLIWAAAQQLSAQCTMCTPVFTGCPPQGGLCNHLDTAYAHHPYDKVLNFYMPPVLTDANTLSQCQCNHVNLNQIRVTAIAGLPTGVNYILLNGGTYNPQSGDTIGCAHFCGTPLLPGTYPVTVYLQADVTAIGTPIGDVTQNNNAETYNDVLIVLPDTIAGVTSFTYGNNGASACDTLTVDLNALLVAPSPNLTGYFWDFGNGMTSTSKTPGTVTYTATSLTHPDTFPLTLTTIFYNYRVKKVHIANITGGYCGDIEELTCACISGADSPDPYIKFNSLGFNNVGSYASNTCTNVDFDNLFLTIPLGTSTIDMELWDLDNGPPFGSADDQLGTYTDNILLGQWSWSNGNADGYIEFDTTAGTVVTETLNIIVYPSPAVPVLTISADTICSTDSARISVNSVYNDCTFEWYNDTIYLTTVHDTAFTTTTAGSYWVRVTNQTSGCSNVSTPKTVTIMQAPPSPISIIFTGTQEFVTPFPISGFAVDWFRNDTLVPGQHGKFLPYLGNGLYAAEVYNSAFPSCRIIATPDSVFVSGIDDYAGNSIFDMSIVPNPNMGKFNVKFSVESNVPFVNLSVRNMLGESVVERKLENHANIFSEEIDLNQFSKGIYTVSLETAKGKLNKKVVIQ